MFVVFYETVEQLRSFSDDFDISISLLSDPGSRIITELGVLNTTLDESDGMFYGIPFPGAFVVGADGRVQAKFFEQNSLVRTHPSNLLRAALGDEVESAPAAAPVSEVEFHVGLSESVLRTMLITDLVVEVEDGGKVEVDAEDFEELSGEGAEAGDLVWGGLFGEGGGVGWGGAEFTSAPDAAAFLVDGDEGAVEGKGGEGVGEVSDLLGRLKVA